MTHICVSYLTIIGSEIGFSPERRQAIFWTNAGILLIGPLGTNFSKISSKIHTFSFKKKHLNMSSVKWRPFYLGLNVLKIQDCCMQYCNKSVILMQVFISELFAMIKILLTVLTKIWNVWKICGLIIFFIKWDLPLSSHSDTLSFSKVSTHLKIRGAFQKHVWALKS